MSAGPDQKKSGVALSTPDRKKPTSSEPDLRSGMPVLRRCRYCRSNKDGFRMHTAAVRNRKRPDGGPRTTPFNTVESGKITLSSERFGISIAGLERLSPDKNNPVSLYQHRIERSLPLRNQAKDDPVCLRQLPWVET